MIKNWFVFIFQETNSKYIKWLNIKYTVINVKKRQGSLLSLEIVLCEKEIDLVMGVTTSYRDPI